MNILGIEYSVSSTSLALNKGLGGECNPDTLQISLDSSLPSDKAEKELIHEVIHAILWETGMRKEYHNEPLVVALSTGIYQVLTSNGLVQKGDIKSRLLGG